MQCQHCLRKVPNFDPNCSFWGNNLLSLLLGWCGLRTPEKQNNKLVLLRKMVLASTDNPFRSAMHFLCHFWYVFCIYNNDLLLGIFSGKNAASFEETGKSL